MEPIVVGICFSILMVLLLAAGIPIWICFFTTGFLGLVTIIGFVPSLNVLATTPYLTTAHFSFTVLPLFILMGAFAVAGGIAANVYQCANNWVSHLSGGLAMATVFACAVFGAVTGASVASAATFTKLALPPMLDLKYHPRLAAGSIAAAGALAAMIPPSGLMVLYSIFTNASLGKLLIAGLIPGLLQAAIFMVMIYAWVRKNPNIAPTKVEKVSLKDRIVSSKYLFSIIIVLIVILGGLYLGVFTPTEAGAMGALTTFIMAVSRVGFRWSVLKRALFDTASTSAMIFIIIVGAIIFAKFIAISEITFKLTDLVVGLEWPRLAILLMVFVFYIMLGCFMEVVAILSLTLPVVFPMVMALGFNEIWFGVMIVLLMEMAVITPPVGLNAYVVEASSGGTVTLGDIFMGILPFWMCEVILLVLLIAFPKIALWLPSMMY